MRRTIKGSDDPRALEREPLLPRILVGLCAFICIFASIHVLGATPFERGYIIKIRFLLDGHPFSPVLINDDGTMLVGDSNAILSKWSKNSGLVPLRGAPSGYLLSPTAISMNGSAIAGIFWNQTDYGLFRWTAATGIQLLRPHLPAPPEIGISGPMSIGNDGKSIAFFCGENVDTLRLCNFGGAGKFKHWIQKTWSEARGFGNVRIEWQNRFDYFRISDSFQNSLVATFTPPTFGRLTADGTYIAFQDIPPSFNLKLHKVVANSDATFVAYQASDGGPVFIWGPSGRLLPPLKLPPGCLSFALISIDDKGAAFGNAYCPKIVPPGSEGVGLRITLNGAQTIGAWLRDSGLPNNLSLNTSVELVSGDGKTVYGRSNFLPTSSGAPHLWAENQKEAVHNESYYFIAHIP